MRKQETKGLTLIELLVVIAIIGILLSIIIAAINIAQQNAREKKRVSDLSNIAFALSVYRQKDTNADAYPSYPNGIEVGVGNSIDKIIEQYNGNIYRDPLSTGAAGSDHSYWYDSDFTCTQAHQSVVFEKDMEGSHAGNFDATCTSSSADRSIAGSNSYILILK